MREPDGEEGIIHWKHPRRQNAVQVCCGYNEEVNLFNS